MYTDDNGIVRFEATDNIAPLQVGLNAALESVSDALDSSTRIWPVANASERDALGVGTPEKPLFVYRADTGNLEKNTGSGWEIYPEPVEDTGWVSLDNPGSVYGPGYTFDVRKIGKIVYFTCSVQSGTSGSGDHIAVLPEGYRPTQRIEVTANTNQGGGTAGTLRINPSGNIEAYASNRSSGTYFRVSGSFPI